MVLSNLVLLSTLLLGSLADAQRLVPKRPEIEATPLKPYKAFPASTPRTKTCFVKPSCTKGRDDSAKILAAFEECNNGGTVVLDEEYTIGSPLDLRFLNHVDIAITGTLRFHDDIDYWLTRTFKFPFQGSSSMWVIGGNDINIYGNGVGVIDGQGQKWYDRFATNATLQRPILLITDGMHGGSITGLKMLNSPNWHNLIANSSDILISDFQVKAGSSSKNPAKNLDGWDTYRSDNIVIQNSYLDHDDDCVSFKPNSTNVIVQGLVCNSSHGISVGSLGQYPEFFDIVENLYIFNVSLSNATDGARLKVWPGTMTDFQPGLGGGGGSGYVRNVTYERFHNDNNDGAIKIDQCYGERNATRCALYPSKMNITDVFFKDFYGTVSKKYDPIVGSLICSTPNTCDNIRAENISISTPSGKTPQWSCRNMDESLLQLNGVGCIPG
ncbi:Exopolygalacturonase X-2 [Paramyrothecium foliicola]|nr:Exopolygalacturonase X-2 [Paramyrothecium foliicola]